MPHLSPKAWTFAIKLIVYQWLALAIIIPVVGFAYAKVEGISLDFILHEVVLQPKLLLIFGFPPLQAAHILFIIRFGHHLRPQRGKRTA